MFFGLLRGGNRGLTSLLTDLHLPAANAAATKTVAAVAGKRHVIHQIAWSYDATPTGGNLKIENGSGTTLFSFDIITGGPGVINFNPKKCSVNTAMIVTLAAGGSGVTGKVNFDYTTEDN